MSLVSELIDEIEKQFKSTTGRGFTDDECRIIDGLSTGTESVEFLLDYLDQLGGDSVEFVREYQEKGKVLK